MKLKFYFVAIACLAICSQSVFAQVGCVSLQPYLDKANHEIHSKKECEDQKIPSGAKSINTCWVDKKNTCYWVGSPAQCTCLQNEGTSCTGALASGAQFGYCTWGKQGSLTGCDEWRLDWGLCKKPGYEIQNEPPKAEDYCRLLGGTVKDANCVDFYNNQRKKTTCSLDDLWNNKCSDLVVKPTKTSH